MRRVGIPAGFRLVAAYLVAALVCWLLAAIALLRAAADVAHGFVASADVLLAVHLLGVGFLPLAVAGAALHVLPTLLRSTGEPGLGWPALALLCAGPFLAVGVARDSEALAWTAASLVGLGVLLVLVQVALLVAHAPAGRMLLASRFGVGAAGLHALLAFCVGPVLLTAEWRPALGVPHDRLIAIHLHLAVVGWLTLLIVAVGRTLGPMLALAPSEPPRRRPLEELVLVAGLWIGVAGFWIGSRPLVAVGGLVVVGSLARFAAVVGRAVAQRRIDGIEGPLAHWIAGLAFLAEATVAGVVLVAHDVSPRTTTAYAILLLLGWAAGVTIGHVGKLLSLSAWTWWPPGPRPKQAAFYPRRVWAAEAAAFALGTELLAGGAVLDSPVVARAGAVLLVLSAVAALAGATLTLERARPQA